MHTWQFEKGNKFIATGLWLAALGIFIQVVSGAAGYPKIPPGIIILAAAGLLVFAVKRRWALFVGVLLGLLVAVGVFVTPGTGYRLRHPADLGPFTGTLVQLAGLAIVLIAGIAYIVQSFSNRVSSISQ